MDNESTIPSQLHPINTVPSGLGPMSGPEQGRQASSHTAISPVLKWLLVAVAIAIGVYLAR